MHHVHPAILQLSFKACIAPKNCPCIYGKYVFLIEMSSRLAVGTLIVDLQVKISQGLQTVEGPVVGIAIDDTFNNTEHLLHVNTILNYHDLNNYKQD